MRHLQLIILVLLVLMIPIGTSSALTQVIETTDQALSIRAPANWIGAEVTDIINLPVYNHVIVSGDSQATIEAVVAFTLGTGTADNIKGKGGFFVSINREIFQQLTGQPGSAANVFAFVLDGIQQDGYTYEGPIEYSFGDTMALAIAVYYGNVASFSMLFERGGLLIGGDIYTNNPNPVEDMPLFLEIFNSFVSPSENARPTTNTQAMGMLGVLANQPPPNNQLAPTQPPAPPTPLPRPTNTPQVITQQPTPQTGNAGPMLTQLQGQQPPTPPPQVVAEDGKKLIASLNGRFQATVPDDWILLENTQAELPLEIILTNDEPETMRVLNGAALSRGAFIQFFVIEGDFATVPVKNVFNASLESLAPDDIKLVEDSRTEIAISDAPAYVAVFGTPNGQIGLWGVVNFGNSVMVIQLLVANADTWEAIAETAIQIVFDIRYQP